MCNMCNIQAIRGCTDGGQQHSTHQALLIRCSVCIYACDGVIDILLLRLCLCRARRAAVVSGGVDARRCPRALHQQRSTPAGHSMPSVATPREGSCNARGANR